MRTFLAVLVSTLLLSMPFSTSACDLACRLRETASECHGAASGSAHHHGAETMPEMDMSSEGHKIFQDAQRDLESPASVLASHQHSTRAQMQMHRDGMQASQDDVSAEFRLAGTNGVSSCTDESCNQPSASAVPSGTTRSHAAPQFAAAIEFPSSANTFSPNRYSDGAAGFPDFAFHLFPPLRI